MQTSTVCGKTIALLAASSALLFASVAAARTPPFDKLVQCEAMETLWRRVADHDSFGACRTPNSRLELEMLAPFKTMEADLCVLQRPPVEMLAGFNCAYARDSDLGANLFCFRETSDEFIKIYRRDYPDKLGGPVNEYLETAARCSVSNGDSTISAPTVFPAMSAAVARKEIGFIVSLGDENPSPYYAHHGFSTLSPEIEAPFPAIEFFQVVHAPDWVIGDFEDVQEIGRWRISIDDAYEMEEQMEAAFEKNGARIWVDYTMFDISGLDLSMSDRQKEDQLAEWQTLLGDLMEDEDFDIISEDEMYDAGYSKADLQRQFDIKKPYGYSDIGIGRMTDAFVVLQNEWDECVDRGGAIGAAVFGYRPDNFSISKYGSLAIVIFGVDACDRYSVRRSSKEAAERVAAEFMARLEEN